MPLTSADIAITVQLSVTYHGWDNNAPPLCWHHHYPIIYIKDSVDDTTSLTCWYHPPSIICHKHSDADITLSLSNILMLIRLTLPPSSLSDKVTLTTPYFSSRHGNVKNFVTLTWWWCRPQHPFCVITNDANTTSFCLSITVMLSPSLLQGTVMLTMLWCWQHIMMLISHYHADNILSIRHSSCQHLHVYDTTPPFVCQDTAMLTKLRSWMTLPPSHVHNDAD